MPPPRRLPREIISAKPDGSPDLPECFVLIDCKLPQDDIRVRYPRFWEYLQTGIKSQVSRGYLASRRRPWYSQENRPAAPFLCTYMGRGRNGVKPFRFLWNQSKATAHNVYLLLYPKGKLKDILAGNMDVTSKVFEALQQIDTSSFIGSGRAYGGGLFKMEPRELAAIPADVLIEHPGLEAIDG